MQNAACLTSWSRWWHRGQDEVQLMHSYSAAKGAHSWKSLHVARINFLTQALDLPRKSIGSRRAAGHQISHSITALSSTLGRSAWPKASKRAIGSPRNPKKRRSRQLLRRRAKRPRDGNHPSVPAKRNSDATATSASEGLTGQAHLFACVSGPLAGRCAIGIGVDWSVTSWTRPVFLNWQRVMSPAKETR